VRQVLILLLLATGCQQHKADVPTCDQMADHVLELFGAGEPFSHAVRDVFAARCTADKWNDDMRSCVATTAHVTEPHNCKQKLTPDQAKELDQALAAVQDQESRKVLPQACEHYEQVLAQVLACDKLPPDLKQQLAQTFADAKASWAKLDDKRELGPMCAQGITALRNAALECPNAAQW
jgi:ABC-type phosphate/phosphonate transport system substrate-binding protein